MATTVTDTIRTRPNTLFGADMSQYDGNVDFASLKSDGLKFAIFRTFGSTHTGTGDTMFEKYIGLAKAQGIPCGSYFFCTPANPYNYNDVKAQADLYINKLKSGFGNYYGDIIPMMDVEDNSPNVAKGQSTLDMSVDDLLRWCNDFRNYFEDRTGTQLGIYTDWYFVNTQRNNFNEGKTAQGNLLKDMPLWMAIYTRYGYNDVQLAGGWEKALIWQYSDQGVFSGMPDNKADLDLALTSNMDDLRAKRVVLTESFVTDTTTDNNTNTVKNPDGSTSTIITTKTTITTSKVSGKKYVL